MFVFHFWSNSRVEWQPSETRCIPLHHSDFEDFRCPSARVAAGTRTLKIFDAPQPDLSNPFMF